MDWQLLLVALAIVTALAYLARRALRTWLGRGTACGGCKCGDTAKTPAGNSSAESSFVPVEQLTLRQRGHG
jgi:hypothetical protein